MNKQTIKVLLASGALAIAAIFGGCNNGSSETCTCNPKEHTDFCGCGGVDCECIKIYTFSGVNSGLVIKGPKSGLNAAEEAVIEDYTNAANLLSDYQGKFAGIGLTINIIDGISDYAKISNSEFNIPRSYLASLPAFAVIISDHADSIAFRQLDTSKETVRLAFDKHFGRQRA